MDYFIGSRNYDYIRDAQEETSTSTSTMMSFCLCTCVYGRVCLFMCVVGVCLSVCVGWSVWEGGRERRKRKEEGKERG